MRHRAALLVTALAFGTTAALGQNVVTLVCSHAPDGPPSFQIDVNFDRSTVSIPVSGTPARISENTIVWERPRYESGGTIMVAARSTLNRTTGVLTVQNDCLARDDSWNCHPFPPPSYCKRGMRQF